jgi:hypothetical protein
LASREGSRSGVELVDVAMNIVAFETMNNVRMTVLLTVVDRHGRADIQLLLTAYDRKHSGAEVKPSVSVNVSCLGTNLRSLEAALIHGLYTLDGKLASIEIAGEGPK